MKNQVAPLPLNQKSDRFYGIKDKCHIPNIHLRLHARNVTLISASLHRQTLTIKNNQPRRAGLSIAFR